MSILNSDFHHGLLGIGVTVAMFSIVYGVALRPLPYADPDRLVVLHDTHPERTGGAFGSWLVNFRDWQQQAKSFSGMAIFAHWTFNLTGRAVPERILGSRVSGEFFDILDILARRRSWVARSSRRTMARAGSSWRCSAMVGGSASSAVIRRWWDKSSR